MVPLAWTKFTAFFWKNLVNFQAFNNDIWGRVKRDFQYQQKDVQDGVSHLENLKAILIEFDANKALDKFFLICFFRKDYKLYLKAQIKHCEWELDCWDKLVEKAISNEAKVNLQPFSGIHEIDYCCPQGNCPADTIVTNIQATGTSDSQNELFVSVKTIKTEDEF